MYAEVKDLRAYIKAGTSETGDDALLGRFCNAAQNIIDNYTSRRFEAVTTTRYYDQDAVEGNDLWLDDDLLSITTLTNGDDAGTTIAASEYFLIPRNETRYYIIRLMAGSSYSWEFDTDGYVSVLGEWGYTETPPWAIKQAAVRLAAYLYRQKDANTYDVTVFPEQGIMTIPQGIPADVVKLLAPYVRVVL